jgi:transcriptional regulator with XRE-family HTH domain
VARRRVRLALRKAREAKSLTQTDVANAMEWSLSKVIRIEAGEVAVSASDLLRLLPYLDIADSAEVDQLKADARASRQQRWSIDPRHRQHLSRATLELLQYEQEATVIRYFHPQLIPGILQTPDYAAAIFRSYTDPINEEHVQVRMEARLHRRDRVLGTSDAPDYLVILDEAVLHREIGGPAVMGDQLRELLRVMDTTRLLVRVIPFTAPAAPIALVGPFSVLDMGDDEAVLYRETPQGDEIVRKHIEIIEHRDLFERLWPLALDDTESVRLIGERAEFMRAMVRRSRPNG